MECKERKVCTAIFVQWTVGIAWMADKTKLRMPYVVLNAVITLVRVLLTAYDKVRSKFVISDPITTLYRRTESDTSAYF
jgi:hypothetical protein